MIKLMFRHISINIPGKIIIWFSSQPSANQRAVITFLTNESVSHLSPVAEYARCCLSTTLLSHRDLRGQSEARVRGFDQSEARYPSPLSHWQPLYSACYQILLMKREMRKNIWWRIKCRKIFIHQDKYFLLLIFRFYCGTHLAENGGIKIPVYLMYHLWNWIF